MLLAGPTPALLARAAWPLRAPRARHGAVKRRLPWPRCVVQRPESRYAGRLLMPGPDGRPSTRFVGAAGAPRLAAVGLHHRLCVDWRWSRAAGGRRGARRHRHATTTGTAVSRSSGSRLARTQPCARAATFGSWTSRSLPTICPVCVARVVVNEGTLLRARRRQVARSHAGGLICARHDLVLGRLPRCTRLSRGRSTSANRGGGAASEAPGR